MKKTRAYSRPIIQNSRRYSSTHKIATPNAKAHHTKTNNFSTIKHSNKHTCSSAKWLAFNFCSSFTHFNVHLCKCMWECVAWSDPVRCYMTFLYVQHNRGLLLPPPTHIFIDAMVFDAQYSTRHNRQTSHGSIGFSIAHCSFDMATNSVQRLYERLVMLSESVM